MSPLDLFVDASLDSVVAEGVTREQFKEFMRGWEIAAFPEERPIGAIAKKGCHIHVAVLPEHRGKWASRRVIGEILNPVLSEYGQVTTTAMIESRAFVDRLGFEETGRKGRVVSFILKGEKWAA